MGKERRNIKEFFFLVLELVTRTLSGSDRTFNLIYVTMVKDFI
jgi:hypothetical protein